MRIPGLLCWLALAACASGQSIADPWSGHAHDPQHTGVSRVASQPLQRIKWQAPVDLAPQYSGTNLLVHYGSPLITRQNTLLLPVKTGADGGFRVEGRDGSDGTVKWSVDSDYILPAHSWTPMFGIALTPKNRVAYPGAGGTVWYRDSPDAATGAAGQLAFYGMANYQAAPATFNGSVKINTPITSDRYGNLYFGYEVIGSVMLYNPATMQNDLPLVSGIARIAEDGSGSWVGAAAAAADNGIRKVVMNGTPALGNDHRKVYVAVSSGNFGGGYLLCLDARTLATIAKVRLQDPLPGANPARLPDDGTASPLIGPDGDVYFGAFEFSFGQNHYRGWLLHYDATLAVTKTPGAFGWDDTPSLVDAKLVPSYQGSSRYLLLCKYNNYVEGGGDGVNKIAILDPNATQIDAVSGATVMKEVITVTGPTPDAGWVATKPNAVREWCVNTVAVDPFTKSAIVNNEDGKVYRWDFASNSLQQALTLTSGIGEAYTPTVIGVDGTVYAMSNAILFAIGQ